MLSFRRIRRETNTDIEGVWFDPLHGGCLRTISGNRILGVYGSDEQCTGDPWYATFTRDGNKVHVHFVGKPGKVPQHMVTRLDGRMLRWSDGNVWRKLYAHRSQLTTKCVSTRSVL